MNRKPNGRAALRLEPGTLWTKVVAQTEHARTCGALQLLPTQYEFVEQGGVNFLVRVLPHLVHKDESKKQQGKETATSGKEFNPFLPYEEDLFVADISDTHLCLLNKFSIIDHHLLIITRSFEEQETWLTLRDFEAMWACLAEIDGLVFYNAGKSAGASQRHKHLQLVPLPLVPDGPKIPIEPMLASALFEGSVGTIPGFPFLHAVSKLDPDWKKSPLAAASSTLECYHNLLRAVGLISGSEASGGRQSGAYNLLATRSWMLLVPRSNEHFSEISVNSLGFAGTLVVRSEPQMKIIKDQGPMTVLRSVAVPTVGQT
jgi:ATP adenylyltransferase